MQSVPDLVAKVYAATQVMDEARHVEAFARLLHETFDIVYPITDTLKALLEDCITDRRGDMTYLGMQILIEALAAIQRRRDMAGNPLAGAVRPTSCRTRRDTWPSAASPGATTTRS